MKGPVAHNGIIKTTLSPGIFSRKNWRPSTSDTFEGVSWRRYAREGEGWIAHPTLRRKCSAWQIFQGAQRLSNLIPRVGIGHSVGEAKGADTGGRQSRTVLQPDLQAGRRFNAN